MKIVCDFTVLGRGCVDPKSRTGIHRYAYNLLLELLKQPEITIAPAAPDCHAMVKRFLQTERACHGLEFLKPSYHNLREAVGEIIDREHFSLPDSSKKVSQWETLKLRWALNTIREVVPKFALPIASATLKGASIYHSPFLQFPKEITPHKRFTRVLTVHDLIPIRFPYYFGGREEQSLRRTIHALSPEDHVICVSNSTREDFLNFTKRLPPENVHVTHLAASDLFYPHDDGDAFAKTCKKYGIDSTRPYVLSLCTLEPRKNLSRLLEAVELLKASGRIDEIQLVLAGGEGWLHEDFEEKLETSLKCDLSDTVLTGRLDDEDLAAIYTGASAFVYPSLYEGFGLPPLEAMCCGTPVITSATSSLPEVVGDAALLVDPGSTEELAAALEKILLDESFAADLSSRGLERAKRFSWKRCADETVEVFKGIHSI